MAPADREPPARGHEQSSRHDDRRSADAARSLACARASGRTAEEIALRERSSRRQDDPSTARRCPPARGGRDLTPPLFVEAFRRGLGTDLPTCELCFFFGLDLRVLMYRMRGAGPAPPGTEYERATMPLVGSVFWSASTNFVVPPGGRSGTPDPRSTGMTASSTVSTSPASRSDRKRAPPPKSQMSRPDFAFSSATTSRGSSLTMRTPRCL